MIREKSHTLQLAPDNVHWACSAFIHFKRPVIWCMNVSLFSLNNRDNRFSYRKHVCYLPLFNHRIWRVYNGKIVGVTPWLITQTNLLFKKKHKMANECKKHCRTFVQSCALKCLLSFFHWKGINWVSSWMSMITPLTKWY